MYDYTENSLLARLEWRWCWLLLIVTTSYLLVACGPAAEQAPVEKPEATIVVEESAVEAFDEGVSEDFTIEESYPPPTSVQAVEESYPPPTAAPAMEEAYPAEPASTVIPDEYPAPGDDEIFQEPRFRLELPIRSGSTVVSGQAPPGMVLAILDVTYNGALLGGGPSDNEGRFSINVQDLVEGNRVGITFGELEPDMTIADMSVKYFPHRGEGFMNLPNVGVVLDSALVEP